jgi:hypothetical protein
MTGCPMGYQQKKEYKIKSEGHRTWRSGYDTSPHTHRSWIRSFNFATNLDMHIFIPIAEVAIDHFRRSAVVGWIIYLRDNFR